MRTSTPPLDLASGQPGAPLPERTDGGFALWERLAREALDARAQGRLEIALAAQVRALWTAETLTRGAALFERPDDCLAALVVSHHNLSDLYLQRGQATQAIEHLCEPHRLLMRLIEDGERHPSAVQQAAWRHVRETRAQLMAWLRERGAEPAIEAALNVAPAPNPSTRSVPVH